MNLHQRADQLRERIKLKLTKPTEPRPVVTRVEIETEWGPETTLEISTHLREQASSYETFFLDNSTYHRWLNNPALDDLLIQEFWPHLIDQVTEFTLLEVRAQTEDLDPNAEEYLRVEVMIEANIYE